MRQEMPNERPKIRLTGEDGNAFFVLGKAVKTARRAGWSEEKIDEFKKKATSGNYDNLLATCMEYFDVS
jgi:hypothetical protein